MRNLVLALLLIASINQAFAYQEAYPNPANLGQNYGNLIQNAMQNANLSAADRKDAAQAMELISDPNVMGNAFQMMNQMTKPIEVSKSECVALEAQMKKAMDMVEKMDPNEYAADSEEIDMAEVKKYMDPNRAETRQGMDQVRKMMSCQKMGYMKMETSVSQ